MQRIATTVRPDLENIATEQGFRFLNMYGQPYWDESTAYRFTLDQVEKQIEDPSTEIHAMVREAVDQIVRDESLMARMGIPQAHWDLVRQSWRNNDPELYGRLDLVWTGDASPVKLMEYNGDTPTSLYEAGSFQWDWLSDMKNRGLLDAHSDQFNNMFDALSERFAAIMGQKTDIHFASGKDNEEDYATVEYLAYAAREAGMQAHHTFLEDVGVSTEGQFIDGENRVIGTLFKLYPWEDMFQDSYGRHLASARCNFLEPAWKALVSNKAILPMLWKMFENHPNLLASFFADETTADNPAFMRAVQAGHFVHGTVEKPLFSREGASVTIADATDTVLEASENREYDHYPTIVQAYCPLPVFDGWRPIIGAWIVGEKCVGMGLREDQNLITQDLSRFKPHFIA